jgi:putative ABC transport system permease protein
LICLEAGIIGLGGGLIGLAVGHLIGAVGSIYTQRVVGETINWLKVGWEEWLYLAIVTAVAVLAGLVPALKAYRTPVATNLVAG